MFHIKMYTMSSVSQSDKIWTRRVDNKGATVRDIVSPLDIVAEISGHFPAALVATEAKTQEAVANSVCLRGRGAKLHILWSTSR